MDRIKRLAQLSGSISLALTSLFGLKANDWLSAHHLSLWTTILVVLLVIILGSRGTGYVLEVVFSSSAALRRVLLGPQFVEGIWVDVIYDGEKPVGVGLVRLEADGFGLKFHGENFDLKGHTTGTFSADMSSIHWPRITLVGTDSPTSGCEDSPRSYCEIQFIPVKKWPMHYAGFFILLHDGRRFGLQAGKVEGRAELNALNSLENCRATLLRIAEQIHGGPLSQGESIPTSSGR